MERRTVMLSVTRRQFLQFSAVSAAGLGASSLGVLGFSPNQVLAEVREYKLARTTETRNTCPYCSVGCGLLMYSLGDKAKNAPAEIIHIEGGPAISRTRSSAAWGCWHSIIKRGFDTAPRWQVLPRRSAVAR